jgi:hypothetical protein
LGGADLGGSNLSGSDLSGANLADANLRDVDLFQALLTGANLEGVQRDSLDLYNQAEIRALEAQVEQNQSSISELTELVNQVLTANETLRATVASQAAQIEDFSGRPTQAAYDRVVAERDARLTPQEVTDLRPGSTLLEVQEGQAKLRLQLQESGDLSTWADHVEGEMTIPLEPGPGTRFFCFAVPE